ncbi:N-6 DNA methylase [Enterococcus ratti]|uniref:N-6 DNA methylase n=1 Tax=Enterococcus ratti TaxID=150033 RepID=A0A1L8WRQ0_9ENTE|nr:N-6 DNA methylase [Enterococcus ratti]OJG83690.1 N-6 DNA methylase [Enterococcus ratti]
MKVKVIIPYLKQLGYHEEEMRFENPMEVVIGSKKTIVYSDIEIELNGVVELIIDVKKPSHGILQKDLLQASSYAKLINTPPALMSTITNGTDTITTNTFTGEQIDDIPSKAQLMKKVNNSKKKIYSEIQLQEIKSVLLTLLEPKELYRIINNSKNVIEKKALIRSDQSFKEITKIILVKMNEERRVTLEEGQNRFSKEYLEKFSKANGISINEAFVRLFNEAKEKYPNIYPEGEGNFLITDEEALIRVVNDLAPFSFLGTGEDIKGAVYEIFLKGTLRGDFDQYFTPREIVDFIVELADPQFDDVFLDPACGSGGFLIQAFNYVNQKIINAKESEVERKKKFSNLVDKHIWGHEADKDLQVLAKINLIMHGDGWNNIYQGDTLISPNLKNDFFDLVLTNPPFTIKYEFPETLSNYEMGLGKQKEELDILFVEKSLDVLKPGGDLYIVLPEGLLNNNSYQYFRNWLMEKADLLCCISLPEGAFIPMGGSVSKTCILGVRKKSKENNYIPPTHAFLGVAKEVGFESGKKLYKKIEKNDLHEFIKDYDEIFEEVRETTNGGEYGWIKTEDIDIKRLGASHLLNIIDSSEIRNAVKLSDIVIIEQPKIRIEDSKTYYYLEIPDISSSTGAITNIRLLKGENITSSTLVSFKASDILFARINPRKNRITLAPPISDEYEAVTSNEIYLLSLIKDNGYIRENYSSALVPILRSDIVKRQIVRLGVGSSSSRARVYPEDLANIRVPIPDENVLEKLSQLTNSNTNKLWQESQKMIDNYVEMQVLLDSNINKNEFRSI